MYNSHAHRGMMPQHVPPGNRINDLLEQIRAEFDNQTRGVAGEYEQQRESLMRQQAQELDLMREKASQIEYQHLHMKDEYEKRLEDMRRQMAMQVPPSQSHAPPPPQHNPGPPPTIGHGPRDLFGQIMAGNGAGGQGQQSLAQQPPPEPSQPQGLPAHLPQNAGINTGPQLPGHQPAGDLGYRPAPAPLNGYGPPVHTISSPGLAKNRGRGPPGALTPLPHQPMPYISGSPRGHMPTPPPGSLRQAPPPPAQQLKYPSVGNELHQLKMEELPEHLKGSGEEWWAIYNPQERRQLDVQLVHTLPHKSVVCCVRFSQDGRYVATGCNRIAQIFDVADGQLAAHLEDDSEDKEGDLYIRSVCFSPDGRFLATGAEDKCIRVWDIAARVIVHTFKGHEQDIYSLDFGRNGRLIASGSGDRTVRLWDLELKKQILLLEIAEGVTTVALSNDGRLVAAGSLDRSVRVWDTETGHKLEDLEGPEFGHTDSVYSVAFSPSGQELVSGSLDKTIKMWELGGPRSGPAQKKGRCLRTFEGHSDFVLSVALTPDGAWVLSGSKDRGVMFWDPRTGVAQLHLQGHRNSVISVAPSPKGGLFATGSGDSKAKIWSYGPYNPT